MSIKNNKQARILFLVATHGDEGFSIPVLQKLEKKYSKKGWNYDWIIANPRAYKESKRYIETDLNRSAPGNDKSALYEERRADELLKLAHTYDLVIDIHGTISSCGIVTIIPLPTLPNLLFAASVKLKNNIIWYSANSNYRGPIVQHCKMPAIELECGPKNNPKTQRELYKSLETIIQQSRNFSISELIPVMKRSRFYVVDGKEKNKSVTSDFEKIPHTGKSVRYAFLTNEYRGFFCYMLKKVNFRQTPLTTVLTEI